jgi:hypothetical protein
VENECCVGCGVPQVVAPDLVGWNNDKNPSCYWKKQPETPDEMRQAFAIFDGQEVGCHRYAGHDPAILARVGSENCDYPPPGEIFLRMATGRELEVLGAGSALARMRTRRLRRQRVRSKRGW